MAHDTSEKLNNSHSQAGLNNALNSRFDSAFAKHEISNFLSFADEHMPPMAPPLGSKPLHAEKTDGGARLERGDVSLLITPEFGIRLYLQGREITTNMQNIPLDYPWFQKDPDDPDDIAGYASRHVARGSRGESPWPESQWPAVGGVQQGEQNWPHRDAAFGPYSTAIAEDADEKAVLLWRGNDTPDTQPDPYGVIPRGIFALGKDSSVILALNHKNRSAKGLHWSPWFVLGFAMPQQGTIRNPSVIFAFPDDESANPMQEGMTKIWNYINIAGQKMALINPHAKTLNEPFKKLYANVNWTAVSMKGMSHIILTRSILRHEEQYFPFLEHGRFFIEVEHTGPRVAPGDTSTVLVKQDFVSLSALTGGRVERFSEHVGAFEQEVRLVLRELVLLDKQGKVVA
jgi:hypothetical protein